MRPLESDTSQDREVVYRERFDSYRRDFLKTLVTPEVIEEHKRSPFGQHSEPLERLLIYFRQQPLADKYAVKVVTPFKAYRLVAMSGHRGVAPRPVGDEVFPTAKEACHGVFLLHIQDLLES
ncbi:hypothetical protein V6C03_07725 [Methyloligella sp. 2.7D]|uniref:hypothetical protein n=1 Tax=unclassified Methyloligella TaxID=2625955 RepID=UPI00157D7587|nr:hypothetical protein [Methyloligella sp. GL2]QKP78236.1 hypothetical protein HT051_12720 [Methyloligella sp. GL2]